MALTEARKRANEKYNKKAYDVFLIRVAKGYKKVMEDHAKTYDGGYLNKFINRAIAETITRDKGTPVV